MNQFLIVFVAYINQTIDSRHVAAAEPLKGGEKKGNSETGLEGVEWQRHDAGGSVRLKEEKQQIEGKGGKKTE